MLYENRSYIIFPVTELNKIDFTKIQETDVTSLRFSVDKTKTFIRNSYDDKQSKDVPRTVFPNHTQSLD